VTSPFEKIAAATGKDLAADALTMFESRLAAIGDKMCTDAELVHFASVAARAFVETLKEALCQ
jgi:hypothetical protein